MTLTAYSTKTLAQENHADDETILDEEMVEYTEYNRYLFSRQIGLPKSVHITLDRVKYRAFTLEQYRELSSIVIGFRDLQDAIMELEEENSSFLIEIDSWEMKSKLWENAAKTQEKRADGLSKMFDDENKLRLKIQKNHKLTNWVPWAISGVLAGLLAGLGTYSWVKSVK